MANPIRAWREWHHEREVSQFVRSVPPPPHRALVIETEAYLAEQAPRRSFWAILRGWSR